MEYNICRYFNLVEEVTHYYEKKNIFKFDKKIITNIIESYLNDMNQYILNSTEKARIEAIYKSIPAQLGNTSNKFQYSKINWIF